MSGQMVQIPSQSCGSTKSLNLGLEIPLTQMDVESRILGVESADFNSVQNKRKSLCRGAAKGSVSSQQHPNSHVLVPMKPYREAYIKLEY